MAIGLSIASQIASETGVSSARATALSGVAISLESRTVETIVSLMPASSPRSRRWRREQAVSTRSLPPASPPRSPRRWRASSACPLAAGAGRSRPCPPPSGATRRGRQELPGNSRRDGGLATGSCRAACRHHGRRSGRPSVFRQPVEDDGGPRRQDERADLLDEAARREVADGPLDPVALGERIRAEGQLTGQLIERQNLGVDEQDFSQQRRLVAVIHLGGGRGAFNVAASRLVVHREFTLLVPCPRLFHQRGGALCLWPQLSTLRRVQLSKLSTGLG